MLEAATGARTLTPDELRQALDQVARAGFSPRPVLVGGRVEGKVWQGRVRGRTDYLLPAEVHYLRHVVDGQEWPPRMSLDEYLQSLREVILDPLSGVATSRWSRHSWHLTVMRRSGRLRGPGGHEWVMVEYGIEGVGAGYWITAFQPQNGINYLTADSRREQVRWLRRPT